MPKVCEVLFDQTETTTSREIGQQLVKQRVRIKRVDFAMELVLHLQEQAITGLALERPVRHDRFVEPVMRLMRCFLQARRSVGYVPADIRLQRIPSDAWITSFSFNIALVVQERQDWGGGRA